MNRSDVSEEQISFVLGVHSLVDALLSQVFKYNLLTTKLVAMVSGTILASSVAVGSDEVITTIHAFPVHVMGCHENTFS